MREGVQPTSDLVHFMLAAAQTAGKREGGFSVSASLTQSHAAGGWPHLGLGQPSSVMNFVPEDQRLNNFRRTVSGRGLEHLTRFQ